MNDKNIKEQEIIDKAYRVSKEINSICDKNKKEKTSNEKEK